MVTRTFGIPDDLERQVELQRRYQGGRHDSVVDNLMQPKFEIGNNIGSVVDVITGNSLEDSAGVEVCRVETSDFKGASLDLCIGFNGPVPASVGPGALFQAKIHFGSGGMAQATARVDIGKGTVISVPASACRVLLYAIAGTPGVKVPMGAYATFGNRRNARPSVMTGLGALGAGATSATGLTPPDFVRDMTFLSSDMAQDTFQANFRDIGGGVLYTAVKNPATPFPPTPIFSRCRDFTLTNLDPVNAIANLIAVSYLCL